MAQGVGDEDRASAPALAALKEACCRVVTALRFAVPEAPGEPVWSWTHVAPMAKLVLLTVLSNALAKFTVERPSAKGITSPF
jgi:hypothetical protein